MCRETTVAICVGVTVGALIGVGVGIYIYNKNKTVKDIHKPDVNSAKLDSRAEFDSVMNVETLYSRDITDWFRENENLITSDDVIMVVAYAKDELLNGIRYDEKSQCISEKDIIQMFYDKKKKSITKVRLIICENIETNLEMTLMDRDGFMIVTQ